MAEQDVLSGLEQELRRGTVVLCALHMLHTPMYGYALVSSMAKHGVQVETNTLYPLLRRLESQGLLDSTWDTSEAKPRKYYSITKYGNKLYEVLKEQWEQTTRSVSALLEAAYE